MSIDLGPLFNAGAEAGMVIAEKRAASEIAALKAEVERLRAALKPFADEIDMLGIQGCAPPPERMLMFASDGGGTFLGIQVSALYDAHRAFQQKAGEPK